MQAKKALLASSLILLAVLLFGTVLSYRRIAGWDQSIDPHYSPKFPVRQDLAARINRIALEEYSFNGQHHTLEFLSDGTANYYGEILPLFSQGSHWKFRTGYYMGHTNEFAVLSSWILSQGLQNIADPCPGKRGYDAPVITVTVVVDGRESSKTTCGSYEGDALFHPIRLAEIAMEDVATRIQWQKQD